ncbi:MAG TPA: hypothetical protein VGX76_03710, partial [Pirellulales bacterium]|nr:hypothetical protein [Pirellulales bacterium]
MSPLFTAASHSQKQYGVGNVPRFGEAIQGNSFQVIGCGNRVLHHESGQARAHDAGLDRIHANAKRCQVQRGRPHESHHSPFGGVV